VLVLLCLVVGVVLGYVIPRRGAALGASVALWVAAGALVLVRAGVADPVGPGSVGVWVMLTAVPVGCGLGLFLRGRRPRNSAARLR